MAKQVATYSWEFKRFLRTRAFKWNSSALACKRLAEASKEIAAVAKKDPVLAGEGAVALCERLWPALQEIDSSSGALGNTVSNVVADAVTVLSRAPAPEAMRRRWLDRLYEAIEEDDVDFLGSLRLHWGRICGFPEIASEWADRTLRLATAEFTERDHFIYANDTLICLSSLLESGRDADLRALLSLNDVAHWRNEYFWCEALKRQGCVEDALDYAESLFKDSLNYQPAITAYCEKTLIDLGRDDEVYERYGMRHRVDSTYLNHFRAIKKRYPRRDAEGILRDLIRLDDEPGHWFAAAFRSGYIDIARDCARNGMVDPKTLIRAAEASVDENDEFAAVVSGRALELLVEGYGYEVTNLDAYQALQLFMTTARRVGQDPGETIRPLLASLIAQTRPDPYTKAIIKILSAAEV